jgi:Ca2+-binding EF-hand superfamily protein
MNIRLVLAATAAFALSAPAIAQDSAPKGERGAWMQRDVTRQQAQQMSQAMFQRFDANHDGVLTRQEADQALAQAGGSGDASRGAGRATRMIARLFGDQQSLTLAQAQAQALARFDAQDANHDGIVSSAEREQARAARRAAQ